MGAVNFCRPRHRNSVQNRDRHEIVTYSAAHHFHAFLVRQSRNSSISCSSSSSSSSSSCGCSCSSALGASLLNMSCSLALCSSSTCDHSTLQTHSEVTYNTQHPANTLRGYIQYTAPCKHTQRLHTIHSSLQTDNEVVLIAAYNGHVIKWTHTMDIANGNI